MTHDYVLGLGSCLNNPHSQIQKAIDKISFLGSIIAVSRSYETEPMLPTDYTGPKHNTYINAAVRCQSHLPPQDLLKQCVLIEQQLGRSSIEKGLYLPRCIDIDILLCDQRMIHLPQLVIPHPLFWQRAFAIWPAADCWADWCHPLFRDSLTERKSQLQPVTSFNSKQVLTCANLSVSV